MTRRTNISFKEIATSFLLSSGVTARKLSGFCEAQLRSDRRKLKNFGGWSVSNEIYSAVVHAGGTGGSVNFQSVLSFEKLDYKARSPGDSLRFDTESARRSTTPPDESNLRTHRMVNNVATIF